LVGKGVVLILLIRANALTPLRSPPLGGQGEVNALIFRQGKKRKEKMQQLHTFRIAKATQGK
jgi:hypothetical protein